MPLGPGSRLGPYEILAAIGAGGMGEVYRARDTRLKRDVALKILPESFASDPDRLARFQREAEVLASLSHPNIAGVYGFEESDGIRALVMELVEGQTLADCIARGPIPLDEALPIAKQIAEALEAAHEQGIVHRDLKPANVKVTPDGRVKVLDFGLAKLTESTGSSNATPAALSMSPTITSPVMTGVGVLLGTAAYMAPEQARAKAADKRSDIWAFGCVLFEILSGRRAFEGNDVADTLAAVLRAEPTWTALPSGTPPPIRRLLRRCLEKDKSRRLDSAAAARLEIDQALSGDAPEDADPSPSRRHTGLFVASAIGGIALVAAAIVLPSLLDSTDAPELRLDITTPPASNPESIAVSPDGRMVVFEATVGVRSQLWLREFGSTAARPLARTDNARLPFWSPDSKSVGFFAGGGLVRIEIDGGLVQTLTPAGGGNGGTWNSEGTLLFSPTGYAPIVRIAMNGGETSPVTRLAPQQRGHLRPQFLPDGRHFLYFAPGAPDVRGVYVGDVTKPETHRVIDAGAAAVYVSGHLLFVRQDGLFAQRFDPVQLAVIGSPFPVVEPTAEGASVVAVSASAAGPIIYRTGFGATEGARQKQLAWFDRAGRELATVGDPFLAAGGNPSLSRDGRRVVLVRRTNQEADLWLLDVTRGVFTRLTSEIGSDNYPIWSPDGSRIAYQAIRGDTWSLRLLSTDGTRREEVAVSTPCSVRPLDWSPDGRWLLYRYCMMRNVDNVWALPMVGDRKPVLVAKTDLPNATFSPDGRWLAYESGETGQLEVYIRPFQPPGNTVQISTAGGAQPRWRQDGKELFYVALDGRLTAVPLGSGRDGQSIEPGAPVPLFATRIGGAAPIGGSAVQYVVAPDGRFLMNTIVEEATAPITLILNWKPKEPTR